MEISAATRLVAVIGDPVTHSLSPAIHNAAFRELGVDMAMVGFGVAAGGGHGALDAMSALGIVGYAVTTPLKAEIADAVDSVDSASASLNSVNTVVRHDDGTLAGASTDGEGFLASIRAAGHRLDGARVVVLGAGAAARSIVHALGGAGVERITIVNRSPDAAEVAAMLAEQAEVGDTASIADSDMVVNTTSVGMGDRDATPLADPAILHPGLIVADIVYHPLETRLLRDAAAAGAVTVDGLGMLIEQARLQQSIWLGTAGNPITMREAAQAQLARR